MPIVHCTSSSNQFTTTLHNKNVHFRNVYSTNLIKNLKKMFKMDCCSQKLPFINQILGRRHRDRWLFSKNVDKKVYYNFELLNKRLNRTRTLNEMSYTSDVRSVFIPIGDLIMQMYAERLNQLVWTYFELFSTHFKFVWNFSNKKWNIFLEFEYLFENFEISQK